MKYKCVSTFNYFFCFVLIWHIILLHSFETGDLYPQFHVRFLGKPFLLPNPLTQYSIGANILKATKQASYSVLAFADLLTSDY